jgi:drug/metabolite transporter (DMT)-like permease
LEQIVSLLFKLALYPVVCIGAGLSLGALYSWLRHCAHPEVAVKVRAQLLTGLVAIIALDIMSPGAPEKLDSFGAWLALALYGATAYAGGSWVWRKRNQLVAWFVTTFELR